MCCFFIYTHLYLCTISPSYVVVVHVQPVLNSLPYCLLYIIEEVVLLQKKWTQSFFPSPQEKWRARERFFLLGEVYCSGWFSFKYHYLSVVDNFLALYLLFIVTKFTSWLSSYQSKQHKRIQHKYNRAEYIKLDIMKHILYHHHFHHEHPQYQLNPRE